MVRCVTGARREVHEERPIGHQCFLLPRPLDCLVRHVFREVITLFRSSSGLDRRGALVDRRIPLVGFAADKAIEVFEAATAGGPLIKRSHGAGLPYRHLVALAELRGGIAIELQRHREGSLVLRQHRAVARSGSCYLADAAHVHRMMVAAGQQCLTRRRTECRGVKAVELETIFRQPFSSGCMDGATEGTGGCEAHIVQQYDEHIGCARGWFQRCDRRESCIRILGVVGGNADILSIGNRKNGSLSCVHRRHAVTPLDSPQAVFYRRPLSGDIGPWAYCVVKGFNDGGKFWSGRRDLNSGPLAPHASALPGCATSRPGSG